MKIIFFGTPDYVVCIADKILKHFRSNANQHPIAAVVTQSPKPSGRGQELKYSPVDEWAYERQIPKYFDPMDIVKEGIDADIGVLAAYGAIIPNEVINHFRYGILNAHPSLLPNWRGASPVQASIVSGEVKTGATIIKLDIKLDHGPIVGQFKDEVFDTDTTETLRNRLFERSAEVMTGLIDAYVQGKIKIKEQDHDSATFTKQIVKDDAFIPPNILSATLRGENLKGEWVIPWIRNYPINYSPITLNNYIRAMTPWPSAWSNIKIGNSELRIKILKSHVSDGNLIIDSVQLEGKSPVSWKQFLEGYPEAKFE